LRVEDVREKKDRRLRATVTTIKMSLIEDIKVAAAKVKKDKFVLFDKIDKKNQKIRLTDRMTFNKVKGKTGSLSDAKVARELLQIARRLLMRA